MRGNPKLMVFSENQRGTVFELTGETMSCGRREGVDIRIRDGSLSSHHCDFMRDADGGYVLRDNHSTNGSRVNGRAVTEQKLLNQDTVRLGGIELVYISPGEGLETGVSRTHTIVLDRDNLTTASVAPVTNLSPFDLPLRRREKRQHRLIILLLALLGMAVLGLLAAVLLIFVGNAPVQ